ncbi:hypothetical protein B6S08_00555 [Oceanimonas doudoroffii]|uniref:Pilus assembly protein FimV n=1 Tax=Oceanimonas doudoroffii TaxID=84158 RepID=A0A233RF78_9GAMM|nr:hypothetical protein B6S08_00555 [Oceanimonas doudoroffii]
MLALWLSVTLPAAAQEFYIELRGPETPAAAPTPAPEVVPAASQPSLQRPGRYGPITSTDTLWSIAARNTSAPATVQQTMVALYYLNPGAFVRGNINYLQRGASLRLPTLTQAQQRTPAEAEAEFRRLSQQGSRREARPQVAATPAPARPATQAAPVVATPPATAKPAAAPAPKAAEPAPSHGLSEPRAAQPPAAVAELAKPEPAAKPEPVAPAAAEGSLVAAPDQAEQVALERLQARLLDELREQMAMSNEQLAALADNNQALRNRLSQLTAEVNELKMVRLAPEQPEPETKDGWLAELLGQPLNLALLLLLPALLLMALFTLWWRSRLKRELAEQEAASSELMMDDDDNDFGDLFATEPARKEGQQDNTEAASPADAATDGPNAREEDESGIDEDAFARFLEEQERLEEEEQQPRAEDDEVLFDDAGGEVLFDDAGERAEAEVALDDDDGERPTAPKAEQSDGGKPRLDNAADDDEVLNDGLIDQAPARDDESELALDDGLFDQASARDDESELALDDGLFDQASARDDESELALDDGLFDNDEATTATEAKRDYARFALDAEEEPVTDKAETVAAEPVKASADQAPRSRPASTVRPELDDYAGLLSDEQDTDIDLDEGGMGAKLDLARAYIEIEDADSARELLNEALEKGNAEQQADARKLLQRLGKR